MIEIRQIANNKYQLIEDGEVCIKDVFFKIERLNENSNYYLLFPNESCFLLYHIINHRFALNEGFAKDAHSFIKIEAYSYETGSFAAYRSDTALAHLIYEDGSFEKDTYLYIGPESNDSRRSRPVQLTGYAKKENMFRWIYFHGKERKYGWDKKHAYEYYDGTYLSYRFKKGYYSTYKDGQYKLYFYETADNFRLSKPKSFDFKAYFDSILESHGYLVCKLHNKSVYRIYKEDYSAKPIASFSSAPILLEDKRMFVCKENEGVLSFFDLDSNMLLENESWDVHSDYEIEDNFLFVKTPGRSTWKIYSRDNGKEVYTSWEKITLKREGDSLRLFVDTDDYSDVEILITGIEKYQLEYLSKLSSLSQPSPSDQPITEDKREPTPTEIIAPESQSPQIEIKSIGSTPLSNVGVISDKNVGVISDKIDFIISLSQISIRPNNTIICNKSTRGLHTQDVIFWLDKTKHIVYVSRLAVTNAHRILWRKQLDDDKVKLINDIPNKFYEANLSCVTEQNVIEKVSSLCQQSVEIQKAINDRKEQKNLKELDIRYNKLISFMMQEDYPKEKMDEVVKILLPDWKKPEPPVNNDKVVFKFNDESFSIAPDETWIIKNPFSRQSFLRKTEIVAVLLNKNFIEYSDLEGVDYEMEGQGQDPKFDQYFSPENANTAIKDNERRILLFKKINNGNVFFDEVECVGYHMAQEYGIGGRKLIIFHLKSKCRRLPKRKIV